MCAVDELRCSLISLISRRSEVVWVVDKVTLTFDPLAKNTDICRLWNRKRKVDSEIVNVLKYISQPNSSQDLQTNYQCIAHKASTEVNPTPLLHSYCQFCSGLMTQKAIANSFFNLVKGINFDLRVREATLLRYLPRCVQFPIVIRTCMYILNYG